jgi:hypothetical protein
VEAKGRSAMRLFSRGIGSLLEWSNIRLCRVVFRLTVIYVLTSAFFFVGALSIAELLRWDCLLSHMTGTLTCDVTGL